MISESYWCADCEANHMSGWSCRYEPPTGPKLYPHHEALNAQPTSHQYREAVIWRLDRWWAGKTRDEIPKHYFGESREAVERQIDDH